MTVPYVSIVIPVFNGEMVLSRAVESARMQTLPDIEIIIVDDASTDGSSELANRLSEADSRISVIHQPENRQLFEARKTGVEHARGKYIVFLDSDDYLEEEVCAYCKGSAAEGDYDIIQYPIRPQTSNGLPSPSLVAALNYFLVYPGVLVGEEIAHAVFGRRLSVWNLFGKLISRELLLKAYGVLPSKKLYYGEDACLMLPVCCMAQKFLGLADAPSYGYFIDTGYSNSRQDPLKVLESVCDGKETLDCIHTFLDDAGIYATYEEDYLFIFRNFRDNAVDRLLNIVPAQDRAKGYDVLLETWPAAGVVGRLAVLAADYPVRLIEQLSGASSLAKIGESKGRIAIYYFRMGTGGAERVTRDLAVLWIGMGYEVILITDEEPKEDDYKFPSIIKRVVVPDFRDLDASHYYMRASAFTQIVSEYGIDTIVYAQWVCTAIAWDMLLLKSLGLRVIVHTHGPASLLFGTTVSEFHTIPAAYSLSDGVVCLSAADAAYWSRYNSNIYVTINPLAFDVDSVSLAPLSEKNVLWLGRMDPDQKRPHDALLIFSKVVERVPEACLMMVGGGDAGYMSYLRDEAERLNIAGSVSFCGNQADVEKYYENASVFLMTSRFEGAPLTLSESSAAGLPCVMYELRYLAAADDGRGIRSVPFGDVQGAADAVVAFLEDVSLRNSFGKDARRRIEDEARFDRMSFWTDVFSGVGHCEFDSIDDRNRYESIAWDSALSSHYQAVDSLKDERDILWDRATQAEKELDCLESLRNRPLWRKVVDILFPGGSRRRSFVKHLFGGAPD